MTWGEYGFSMFLCPIGAYIVWIVLYGFINFVWAEETIRRKNYDNSFLYFRNKDGIKGVLDKAGPTFAPLVFLFGHFVIFLVMHCVAVICYHSFWLNTSLMVYFILVSFWNGSCYYMEHFAKKYEQ